MISNAQTLCTWFGFLTISQPECKHVSAYILYYVKSVKPMNLFVIYLFINMSFIYNCACWIVQHCKHFFYNFANKYAISLNRHNTGGTVEF